jgi:hypothetical protein
MAFTQINKSKSSSQITKRTNWYFLDLFAGGQVLTRKINEVK